MTPNDLLALLAAETTPCKKHHCPMQQKCADERLACDAFLVYVDDGRAFDPRLDLKKMDRQRLSLLPQLLGDEIKPTRAKFLAMSRECEPTDETKADRGDAILFSAIESRTELDMVWR